MKQASNPNSDGNGNVSAGGGNYASAQTRISNTVKRTASGDIPPAAQSAADSRRTGRVISNSPAERIRSSISRKVGDDRMPTSGIKNTAFTAAGSLNPLDRRTDMQRASQNAGAMSIQRMKDRDARAGKTGQPRQAIASVSQSKPYSNAEQDAARSLGVKTQYDTEKDMPQVKARAADPQTYQSDKERDAERAYKSIGSAAGGGNYAAAQTRISNTVKRTASGDIPPTAQTKSDSDRTGSVIRTNIERIKSRDGNNSSLAPDRNVALDQPASQSPMAKAIERKDAATDAADAAKRADMRGATGNPNIAPAKIGASKKLDFKQAYAAARKAGQTGFEWEGKKYNTKMKGETATKRKQVLSRNVTRTAGRKARTGNQLNEMSLKEKVMTLVREKLDGTV
jgi:hypothetical protein